MENFMNQEKPDTQTKEQFRVVINREANASLEAFVDTLADGNESSKITKSDLANYVFSRLKRFLGATEISEIRSIFFDAKKALEGILKEAGSADEIPEELRQVLLKHCGIKAATKEKRSKKSTSQPVDNSVSVEE
jgi:hypothetical protein